MSDQDGTGTNHGVAMPTERVCPACGCGQFQATQYPADTIAFRCAACGNRCLLADLRESSPDSRWFDAE